jgi:hypothetical protein
MLRYGAFALYKLNFNKMFKKSGYQFRIEKKRKLELQDEVVRKTVKLDKFFQKEVLNNEENDTSGNMNNGTYDTQRIFLVHFKQKLDEG